MAAPMMWRTFVCQRVFLTGFLRRSLHENAQRCRVFSNFSRIKTYTSVWRYIKLFSVGGGLGVATGLATKLYTDASHVSALESSPSPALQFNFIADVVEKCSPAVVFIEIQGRHPFSGRSVTLSNGSGFIVQSDGLILTNAHVVANEQKVNVRLNNGTNHIGYVQAVDPVSDLATIRIKATGLLALSFGDSSRVRPGEWVVAMGSPLSLNNTVTAGIVSSACRPSKELGLHNKDIEYIQTDATINFGNSGGPLINLAGEVIGINSMKVTAGISFAIPSDYAKKFLAKAGDVERQSKTTTKRWFGAGGDVKKRYIGITMLTLTPNLLRELQTRDSSFDEIEGGVLIHKVHMGSPAYSGGLEPGDVLCKINGKEVTSSNDVYKAVETTGELQLTVRRGKKTLLLTVVAIEVS